MILATNNLLRRGFKIELILVCVSSYRTLLLNPKRIFSVYTLLLEYFTLIYLSWCGVPLPPYFEILT